MDKKTDDRLWDKHANVRHLLALSLLHPYLGRSVNTETFVVIHALERRKFAFLVSLVALLAGTIAYGVMHKHFFVVFVFAVWCIFELGLWWVSRSDGVFPGLSDRVSQHFAQPYSRLAYLVQLYDSTDRSSERLLETTILELKLSGRLTEMELRFLSKLSEMLELRSLWQGKHLGQRGQLKRAFLPQNPTELALLPQEMSVQDIAEAAVSVAHLHRKVFEESLNAYSPLRKHAVRLVRDLLGTGTTEELRDKMENIADSMQRDSGLPYLVLNLIQGEQFKAARQLTQKLLTEEYELDEELRCSLYWLGELSWFLESENNPVTDHESAIRYLYHLCFTSPERIGFLEVDSQFFSQFETVSELARDGFLFKEALVEGILDLWASQGNRFDQVFCTVLEAMTQQRSKIYDCWEAWQMFWRREAVQFGKDYLYVVEGNIALATGHYDDAKAYYEKALRINSSLRSASLNLLFCHAKAKNLQALTIQSHRIENEESLLPFAYSVLGNAWLLAGDAKRSDSYYAILKQQEGWTHKTNYYRSLFCYEHGLMEKALEYGRLAIQENPGDTSIRYHLSVIYNALGEKEQALDAVRDLKEVPQWVDYYRFTLERDAGQFQEASSTLLKIPSEYFQDPEELEEALEFARARKDLVLLRHLKKRA